MATPKQLEANRRNAQKSTGPKTPQGKAKSKLNALKHGILARQVVLRGQHNRERSREFASLHRQYWESLAPDGPVEEMLVERIVTTYWRLQRVLIAERGEIAVNVEGGYWRRKRPGNVAQDFVLAALSPMEDMALKMEESSVGLGYLRSVLRQVREIVERDGELTDAALKESYYGSKPNYLTKRLTELRMVPVPEADGLDEAALKAKRREQILAAIDRMWNEYLAKEERVIEREHAEEAARQAAEVLPSSAALDKILRYETTLERQLYRALNQLERLQRMRRGDKVPPPFSVI